MAQLLIALDLALAAGMGAACASDLDRRSPAANAQSEANRPQPASVRDQAAALLSRAIQFRTENPPGEEAELAAFLVTSLQAAGIEAASIATPSEPTGRPRAAAWGRLPGTGRARPVVLLSHLDVVPADPAAWSFDPFAGTIADGFVYGRGALDAKGVSVIHLLTLIELSRRGRPLDRDVILLATPDEEAGGRDGAGFLVREHATVIGDAEYLLTEGGGIRSASGAGGSARETWSVTVTEKTPCWLELVTQGTPGHSSAPERTGAVSRLVAALDRIRRFDSPVRVVPAVERMFRALAPAAPEEDRTGYLHLRDSLSKDPSFRRRFLAHHGHNALVRNTISITVLEGGPRTNVAPGRARAHLDARLLPGERCDEFQRTVAEVIDDPKVQIEPLLSFPSRASPADTDLFRAIESVAHEAAPNALVVPRVIAGFTDAHWFRERGVVAYGFVPRRLSAEDVRTVHGPDERVSLDNIERGVRTLIRILEALRVR